ncbi:MAG: DUF362 domain-containing protein [Muribaculaceae bacterium]|nr:DUF362 domain-containing protein [Muribaculaceae bacterium]
MKTKFLSIVALTALLTATACGANKSQQSVAEEENLTAETNDTATVYYIKDITPQNLVKIYEALGVPVPENAKVAVKISTGESKESYNLEVGLIKDLVQKVNGTLVESNTAYAGNRNTTEAHRKAIEERGYLDIADVDILDAEGTTKIPVKDTTWIHYDIVGSHLPNYDYMINLAHFKGHQMGGFGGVLKNASIGVASSSGKTYIHTAGRTEDVEKIWQNVDNQDGFIESMAAAAQGVHDYFKQPGKDIVYIDVMNNMSIDCDCNGHPEAPVLKDMGILASTDPVALDKACLDLVFGHENVDGDDANPMIERIKQMHGTHIIEHAEKIGLGTTNYKLVTLD